MFRLFASLFFVAVLALGQTVELSLEYDYLVTAEAAQKVLPGAIGDGHHDSKTGTGDLDALHDCPHVTCSHSFLIGTNALADLLNYDTQKEVLFINRFLLSAISAHDPPIPKTLIQII